MRFNTALLHGDFRGDKKTGATQTPVYQSSAFEHASAETLEKIFNNKAPGFFWFIPISQHNSLLNIHSDILFRFQCLACPK